MDNGSISSISGNKFIMCVPTKKKKKEGKKRKRDKAEQNCSFATSVLFRVCNFHETSYFGTDPEVRM